MIHKNELIERVAGAVGLPVRKVENVVTLYFKLIAESLKCGESVHISRFGTFDNKIRAPVNKFVPSKRKFVLTSAKKIPVFIPSDILKKEVNGND